MTDTSDLGTDFTTESDPAYEAFAEYLDIGSLRDAYRQRSTSIYSTTQRLRCCP